MPSADRLSDRLDRLAAFDPGPFPVLSLYLNMQPGPQGRDQFEPFLRKELNGRLKTFPARGAERDSLEQDAERVRTYLQGVDPAANGLALFSSSGAGFFEALPLAAPIHEHRLYVSEQPHVYPLARLIDEYPRYAVLVADTRSARIFVFAANALERREQIEGVKTKHHKMGGWSQARYQRHTENYHLHHAKEVVDALARIVRDEDLGALVIAGDEVIVPLLEEQLPKELAERVVDVVKLDIRASEREVLEKTIAALRERDVESDRQKVDELVGAYRANGLAVVGVDQTRRSLELGEVDELIIAGSPDAIRVDSPAASGGEAAGGRLDRTDQERAADELVARARHTGATIRFIEDASLLANVGGVGALLRFKT
jgi:peptide chain release factor subunit 1